LRAALHEPLAGSTTPAPPPAMVRMQAYNSDFRQI
jgi:hypothetical protein